MNSRIVVQVAVRARATMRFVMQPAVQAWRRWRGRCPTCGAATREVVYAGLRAGPRSRAMNRVAQRCTREGCAWMGPMRSSR